MGSQTLFGGLVSVMQNINFAVLLLLFRQRWRMAINRSAEAMTFSLLFKRFISIIHGSSMVVLGLPIPNHLDPYG
jgi:hypothetical protein